MRHHIAGRKLSRTRSHRTAMLANMASSLITHDRIETTLPRAKELKRLADRIVTLGKKGTVAARRRAIQLIRDKKAVSRAFSELAERYASRQGGYTRILKLGRRQGDGAAMAVIEYVGAEFHAETAPPKKGKAKKAPKKAAAKKEAEPKEEKKAKTKKKAPAKKAAAKKASAKKETKKAATKKKSGRKVTKKKED